MRTFSSPVSLFDVVVAAKRMVDNTIVVEEIMSKGVSFASSPIASMPIAVVSVTASVLSSNLPSLAARKRRLALSRVKGRPR